MISQHSTTEIKYQEYQFTKFICMSVYPKNHKSGLESELRMVPLKNVDGIEKNDKNFSPEI